MERAIMHVKNKQHIILQHIILQHIMNEQGRYRRGVRYIV